MSSIDILKYGDIEAVVPIYDKAMATEVRFTHINVVETEKRRPRSGTNTKTISESCVDGTRTIQFWMSRSNRTGRAVTEIGVNES